MPILANVGDRSLSCEFTGQCMLFAGPSGACSRSPGHAWQGRLLLIAGVFPARCRHLRFERTRLHTRGAGGCSATDRVVRSVCYSSVLGEWRGFERASCSCSEACSCVTAEVSSVDTGSAGVFISARVFASTVPRARRVVRKRWPRRIAHCRTVETSMQNF